jgi:toxin-antitoxin system PIN domain toxin
VIAIDTNVLLHAHRAELPKHAEAKALLIELAEGAAPWGLPVFVIGEFLRVITHARVSDPPHSVEEAIAAVEALLASPSVRVLSPAEDWPRLLAEALRRGSARGNLVFDAQIVAVCREHRVTTIVTEDRDFERFDCKTMRLD